MWFLFLYEGLYGLFSFMRLYVVSFPYEVVCGFFSFMMLYVVSFPL